MKMLEYSGPGEYSVKDGEKPVCSKKQVLIRVKACGICKTDVHIHEGHFLSGFPLTPGHEFTGEIVQIGDEVVNFKVGDRVVADNTVLCGECYYCRRNRPLFCENFYSLGVTGPGGFAEYVVVNHDKVFGIQDSMSFDVAAFAEPTACAVHGMDVIDPQTGDDILLFGSGATGIILAQLLKYGGAGNLVVVAPSRFKLDILEDMGIRTIQMDKNDYSRHEGQLKAAFPKGFDVIIDATGASRVTQHCIQFAKFGAKIVIYGVCGAEDRIQISPYEVFSKELKIMGSFAQTHCFDRALKYLENGIVQVDRLITHRFDLDEYAQALQTVMDGSRSIKVMIHP